MALPALICTRAGSPPIPVTLRRRDSSVGSRGTAFALEMPGRVTSPET